MTTVRVMAIFQGASLVPEDRFVNTFHFHTEVPGIYSEAADLAMDHVQEFYESAESGSSMGFHLSPWVLRVYTLQAYNMFLPAGEREPTVRAGLLDAAQGGGMPEEVALCLTLEGAPPVNARRRGRLFIGPLSAGSFTTAFSDTSDRAGPNLDAGQGIGGTLLARATKLASYTNQAEWCIRSVTPTENYVPIVGGYIDNSFDTQRRRGVRTTARIAFSEI